MSRARTWRSTTRFAEGQFDRLKTMAEDFVRRQVSVITASSVPAALAAKQATTTIPTVFSIGDDPFRSGNATGMYELQSGLEAMRLGLLHDLVPSATTVAVLVNPNNPTAEMSRLDAEEAAAKLGVKLIILTAMTSPCCVSSRPLLSLSHISACSKSYTDILDACQDAWRKLLAEFGRITSIAARDWAIIGQ
jgi:putative ABC transport system substrate-binding protein